MVARFFKKQLDGLNHILFPSFCAVCNSELSRSEKVCCFKCESELHYTYFELTTESTSLDKLFWGRVKVEHTYALLHYEKTNSSQQLLKKLKYKQIKQIGLDFGSLVGEKIKSLDWIKDLDALIPVPIHPKKEFKRGYNQSELLSVGISQVLSIPVDTQFLKRNVNDKSQTKLGRFTRWENVSGKFSLNKIQDYKHIALVDDVVTTGSTLETIIALIHEHNPTIQISVISLAVTK